ncbi:MAG TPA: AzlD domain-containing protein [Bacillota bacterium]|nr:AzlD domain-containing protein [Bacillota bacterium]
MSIILIIIGMSIATMIPRVIPVLIIEKIQFKGWLNRWLQAVPYAALGALIFPGILYVKESALYIGFVGGVVATALAYLRLNVIFVVIGAVLTVYILL